jgi:glycine/D-amino acid oxidase-like deaminating enzyme
MLQGLVAVGSGQRKHGGLEIIRHDGKVIVVGGGIMGLCAAWALRRVGGEVALYEQGPLPNPLASSFDHHRLIRYTYGAMTGYARMVREAYAAWDRLWADLGQRHYHETGTLAAARDDDD